MKLHLKKLLQHSLAGIVAIAFVLAGGVAPASAATIGSSGVPLTDLYYNNYLFTTTQSHPNNASLKLGIGIGRYSYYPGDTAEFQLQRKVGNGSWKTVSTKAVKLPFSDSARVISVPSYKTSKVSEAVYYRIYSKPTKTIKKASYSKTLRVNYVNQGKYTGQLKAYYSIVKKYCPTAVLAIKKDLGGAAGRQHSQTHQISISSKVANYSADNKRAVLYHECAHIKQWQLGASSNFLKKYFVNDSAKGSPAARNFSALEHSADCATRSVHGKSYLGYGGYCNGKELAYGKRLMAGKKWW